MVLEAVAPSTTSSCQIIKHQCGNKGVSYSVPNKPAQCEELQPPATNKLVDYVCIDTPGECRYSVKSGEHTDNHTYPPGFLVAKHPDTIREKVLDDQGNHGSDKWHFECGYVRVGQAVHIPEARGKPVVQVCTAHRCLYRLN